MGEPRSEARRSNETRTIRAEDRVAASVREPPLRRKGVFAILLAATVVAIALLLGARVLLEGDAARAGEDAPAYVIRDVDSPPPRAAVTPRVHRDGAISAPRVEVSPAAQDGGPLVHEEPGFSIDTSGESPGIALFPPAGTKPIQRGILVPDEFELPAGYVRHFQATDDGQRVPAILKFHPDYDWLDADGNAVALPEDRVVPPEMAPLGLPIRMLEPPPVRSDTEAR